MDESYNRLLIKLTEAAEISLISKDRSILFDILEEIDENEDMPINISAFDGYTTESLMSFSRYIRDDFQKTASNDMNRLSILAKVECITPSRLSINYI